MKRNNTLLLVCFLFVQLVFSQERKITGKILVKDGAASKVHIINVASEAEVVSDAEGGFSISANIDDVLVLSAEHLEFQRIIIEKEMYYKGKLEVAMIAKPIVLDEVEIVNHNNINAVDLRILPKPAKEYTPAERRLRTASSFGKLGPIELLLLKIPIDPLINEINGRTKKMRENLKVERRELLLAKINEDYNDTFFTNDLKILPDNVNRFKYYLAEDAVFAATVAKKNNELIVIEMIKKAADFNVAVAGEKK